MKVTAEERKLVSGSLEAVNQMISKQEVETPQSRSELIDLLVSLFPEHEELMRRYMSQLEEELKAAELTVAWLHREYLESRWV